MPNFFNPKPLKAANIKNHTVNRSVLTFAPFMK
jgi:hypothetical protein